MRLPAANPAHRRFCVPKMPKLKPYAVERASRKFEKIAQCQNMPKVRTGKTKPRRGSTGGAPQGATRAIGNQEVRQIRKSCSNSPNSKSFCTERVTRKFGKNAKCQ
jgi:hypothetical protein